ncbi:asparaginyl-tRNA synthetase [Elasticomyces elasticus]|nr:asparaginyl-tRNA synthetase [Elasticomyces elasticus]
MRAWRAVLRSTTPTPTLVEIGPAGVSGVRSARRSSTIHGRSIGNIASALHPTQGAAVADDELVHVHGFIRTVRKQKNITFAAVGDGSCLDSLQAVFPPEHAESLSAGAAVSLTGQWTRCPPGKEQTHELRVSHLKVLGDNDAESYPLQKKYHTPEYLRTLPHLRGRLPFNSLLLRLRSQTIATITQFFADLDFVQTHTPIITSSDCEGAGEVFTVSSHASQSSPLHADSRRHVPEEQFFRAPKYLTVSSQLHLEALAQSVGRVWTLSPTFRAEKSDTPRHLSEFYMLEAEMCFVDDSNQVMDVVENMLRAVTKQLQDSRIGRELLQARATLGQSGEGPCAVSAETLRDRWQGVVKESWPRVTYAAAIKNLEDAVSEGRARFVFRPSLEDGLQAEHERYLAEVYGTGSPVFITDYPREQKPFYMSLSSDSRPVEGGSTTVACFDLLVPDVCELVGGSMREYRASELIEAMRQQGMIKQTLLTSVANDDKISEGTAATRKVTENIDASMQWYLDLRKYGSVPHGGFGLGFDRLLSYLAGVSNIRDVVAFPRWYGRCDC